jgi:hypothetical protein
VIAIGAGANADVSQRAELTAHGLTEFRITFGSAHSGQDLSLDGPDFWFSDPDGWLTVYAPDETAARNAVDEVIGRRWCDCYDAGWTLGADPEVAHLYPLGELAAWVVHEPTQVGS